MEEKEKKDKKDNNNKFIKDFARALSSSIYQLGGLKSTNTNGAFANSFLKDVDGFSSTPSQLDLQKWLLSPRSNEDNLRRLASALKYAVSQFDKTIDHYTKILTMDYTCNPIGEVPKKSDEAKWKKFLKSKEIAFDFSKKLNPKFTFQQIQKEVITYGAQFCYVSETDRFFSIQKLPFEYCTINGRTDLGFTFVFDISFFDRFAGVFPSGFPNDFKLWYEDFVKRQKKDRNASPYVQMPIDKSWVFKFDMTTPTIYPPLQQIFPDALRIKEYKDLARTKRLLENWMAVVFKIPTKDGDINMSGTAVANAIAMMQSNLPEDVTALAMPGDVDSIRFDKAPNKDEIIGDGEQAYWESVGISQSILGNKDGTALQTKYSNIADYNYVKHMYLQYSNFMNYHIYNKLKDNLKYSWKIKFDGNSFTKSEDFAEALNAANSGMPVSNLFAKAGYEPYEVESLLIYEQESDIKSLMQPLMTAFTQSSSDQGGRPEKSIEERTDSGNTTADRGDNIAKTN